MTVITTPPLILDSAGKPANGFLTGRQTSRFTTGAGLVTQTQFRAVIQSGQIRAENGEALDIPATPDGQACELWEILSELDARGKVQPRTTPRVVTVPATTSAPYADLVDVVSPPSSGEWVVPPFVQELLDALTAVAASTDAAAASATTATAEAADAEAARIGAVAAKVAAEAVPTTTDGLMKAIDGNAASQYRVQADARLSTTFVPRWKATTAYALGDKVVSPAGDVVSAIAAFTTGASYDATKWALSPTYANLKTLDGKGPGQNTSALRYFHSQLARRESVPVNCVFVGHSLIEGEGASAQAKRGTDRLQTILRARFPTVGVAGGYGYQALRTLSTTWAITNTSVSGGSFAGGYGMGDHSYFVNATGAKAVLNSTICTAVDVFYVEGGGGTFTTKTDGVANGDSVATNGSPVRLKMYRVPGISGAAAPHTVEVNFSSANSICCGFMVYNQDETSGIRVINDAYGGALSSGFLDSTNIKMLDFATLAPAVVSVTCFANDYKTGVNPATSKTNLQNIVTYIRQSVPNASIVFGIEHALGNVGSPAYPWSQYAQIYYDVAAADGNIAVFDFDQRLSGAHAQPTLPGIIAVDNQHYTDAGYLMWAEAYATFLGA
jgi:GDSL-like Lipase/Acylhydrolase family